MHARKVSHKILCNTLSWIHEARLNALQECLLAAIDSQRLSVTGIGRSINSIAKEKHCIKRADRLLSNHHLWAEREGIYHTMAMLMIGDIKRLLILVDWSDLDPHKRHFLIRAAVALEGRSMNGTATLVNVTENITTPYSLVFNDRSDAALNAVVTSDLVNVADVTTSVDITITGGEYSINGGAWASAAGTVSNGDTLQLRTTSSADYDTAVDVVVTVGDGGDTWSVTTLTDAIPDAFAFVDQNDVMRSSLVTSDPIIITGLGASSPISITGGEYSINGGYTSVNGFVNNNDSITVRTTSSADFNTAVDVVLDVSGVSDTFTVTSEADSDGDGVGDTGDNCPGVTNGDQLNTDGDSEGNACDADDDNDGVSDTEDAFPLDATETVDTDGDGIGNNADTDDDSDGVADAEDAFPLDATETTDTDGDGIGNKADTDDDNDNVADAEDAFPLNATETVDTDGDGIGNNADTDDDNDNVADAEDAFPLDATETIDTDGDGIGNTADTNDDNDGVADSEDVFPLDATETIDTDGDGIGNNADTDDDNDNVADAEDAFPLDVAETIDTDGDGIGNNADTDDDNDGVADAEDAFPLDATETIDTDGDGIGNNADTDDDNDGVADADDAFPLDASKSTESSSDSSAGGGGGGALGWLLMLGFLPTFRWVRLRVGAVALH